MFCRLLCIYLTMFEDDGHYALHYELFFRVSHLLTMDNGTTFHGNFYLHFHTQCRDFFLFYFYMASEWNLNRASINVEAAATHTALIYYD